MKNLKSLSVLIIVAAIAGCSTALYSPGGFHVSGYDFTQYTDKGFLFTPEKYLGTYDAIGQIHIDFIPRVQEAQSQLVEIEGLDIIYYGGIYYYVEQINTSDVINHLYEQASEMGANAVTNFNVSSRAWEGISDIRIVTVSGFAIRRTDI